MAEDPMERPRKIDFALLGIIISLLLQGGSALWWASKMDTRVGKLEERLAPVTATVETTARLDERTRAMASSIERIERRLEAQQ